MNKEIKKLSKKTGERFAQFFVRSFSSDFLLEHLPSIFGQINDCRQVKESDYHAVKEMLNKKTDQPDTQPKDTRTAKQILDEAGFILDDEITSKNDYDKYKKFYAPSEALCKFGSYDSTNRYKRLFFILRKNYETLNRRDFNGKEKRQDEYGTSVMSVGISSDGRTVAQICNRYNHTVQGCDNTYNSNLDAIASGLREAFNRDYNLNLGKSKSVELEGFYFANDRLWHYDREINGIKYGKNVVDGVAYDPNEFLVFDRFILDIKNRTVKTGDFNQDGFVERMNELLKSGTKIEITKNEESYRSAIDVKDRILILVK